MTAEVYGSLDQRVGRRAGPLVASANGGSAATFARRMRLGAWLRTLVRAHSSRGWRGDLVGGPPAFEQVRLSSLVASAKGG